MGKRLYIQVDERLAELLLSGGVRKDMLMSIDEDAIFPDRHKALFRALFSVTGLMPSGIFGRESARFQVMARTLYCHYAIIDGDVASRLEKDLGRDRRSIYYYLSDYYDKLAGDKEFRKADAEVKKLLEADKDWRPPRPEVPKSGKKSKKRKILTLKFRHQQQSFGRRKGKKKPDNDPLQPLLFSEEDW